MRNEHAYEGFRFESGCQGVLMFLVGVLCDQGGKGKKGKKWQLGHYL